MNDFQRYRDGAITDQRDVRVDILLETGGGGSGRHVLNLYHGLRRLGWDAHLILSSRRAEPSFATEMQEVPREHITFLDLRRSPHPSDLPAIVQMRRTLQKSTKRHVVHAHSTKAGILGWALRTSASCRVLTPHAYRSMDPTLPPLRRSAIRGVESAFSKAYDAVIAVSPDEREYVRSLGVRPERIHYIPNGIDVDMIATTASRVRGERADGSPVIGFVGRLVPQKNPALFLETLRVLVERGCGVRAMIVGDGPLRKSLDEFAERHNLAERIEWCGNVPAIPELGKMDVMVHTSHYESFPYSLLEAVAAPLPVVPVVNSGSRAIFGDGFAEAIVGDASAHTLADTVMKVLEDKTLQTRHFAAYAGIAKQFLVDTMVERTVAVYENALRHADTRRERDAQSQILHQSA